MSTTARSLADSPASEMKAQFGHLSQSGTSQTGSLLHSTSEPCGVDLGSATTSFLGWWARQAEGQRLWPAFDRFIRETLVDWVGARQVRLFHVLDGGHELRALASESDAWLGSLKPTALMHHIAALGRQYIRGDLGHGPMVEELATDAKGRPFDASGPHVGDSETSEMPSQTLVGLENAAWIFAIRNPSLEAPSLRRRATGGSIGLVVVGELPPTSLSDRGKLHVLANLVNAFWLHVRDYDRLQVARRTDRGSGVLTRSDFLRMAENAAIEAGHEGEPIVMLSVALEGLRRLDDEGQWALRDDIIQKVGRALRRHLRNDDLVGRFSDDRFVMLLRWLDLSLGRLIAGKVIRWAEEAVKEALQASQLGLAEHVRPLVVPPAHSAPVKNPVKIRCGLAWEQNVNMPAKASDELDGGEEGAQGQTSRPRHTEGHIATFNRLLMASLSASATARHEGKNLHAEAVRGVNRSESESVESTFGDEGAPE